MALSSTSASNKFLATMQEPMILCIIRLLALFDDASEIDRSIAETIGASSTISTSKLFKKVGPSPLVHSPS